MLKYICKILNKNTESKSKKNPEIPDFFSSALKRYSKEPCN